MSWKINILFNEASAELNRINVNLSTNDNIRTIERMKNIHYLYIIFKVYRTIHSFTTFLRAN